MATQPGITGSRTYNGQTANLQASVPGMGGLPPGVLAALEEKRRIAAAESAMRLRMQEAQLRAMQQGERRGRRADAAERNPASEGVAGRAGAAAYSDDMEPVFGVAGLGGVLNPYIPGQTPLGPGQQPVAMGMKRRGTAQGPSNAGFGPSGPASGAALSASPASNQPASGGFTAGQQYAGRGGVGGGPVAIGGDTGECADWLGTGSTNAGEQAAILRTNAANRQAQQDAMMQNATQALLAGMGGYRGNKITPIGVR